MKSVVSAMRSVARGATTAAGAHKRFAVLAAKVVSTFGLRACLDAVFRHEWITLP